MNMNNNEIDWVLLNDVIADKWGDFNENNTYLIQTQGVDTIFRIKVRENIIAFPHLNTFYYKYKDYNEDIYVDKNINFSVIRYGANSSGGLLGKFFSRS